MKCRMTAAYFCVKLIFFYIVQGHCIRMTRATAAPSRTAVSCRVVSCRIVPRDSLLARIVVAHRETNLANPVPELVSRPSCELMRQHWLGSAVWLIHNLVSCRCWCRLLEYKLERLFNSECDCKVCGSAT